MLKKLGNCGDDERVGLVRVGANASIATSLILSVAC